MRYIGYTSKDAEDTIRAQFLRDMGYRPEEVKTYWGNWTSPYRFYRVGPCYPTRIIPAESVIPGMIFLHNNTWHTVGIVDGPTVLTDDDRLVTLSDVVTIRL
jgi:hypothetical protein